MLLDFILLLFYVTLFSKIHLKLLFSVAGFSMKVVAFLNGLGKFPVVFSCGFHHLFCVVIPCCFLFLGSFLGNIIHCLTMNLGITSRCAFANLPLHFDSLSCQFNFQLLVGFSFSLSLFFFNLES